MKTRRPISASATNHVKARELRARIPEARQCADAARHQAEAAKAEFKRVRKVFKQAKKAAKEARKHLRALKEALRLIPCGPSTPRTAPKSAAKSNLKSKDGKSSLRRQRAPAVKSPGRAARKKRQIARPAPHAADMVTAIVASEMTAATAPVVSEPALPPVAMPDDLTMPPVPMKPASEIAAPEVPRSP